jgi:hypothetical protein
MRMRLLSSSFLKVSEWSKKSDKIEEAKPGQQNLQNHETRNCKCCERKRTRANQEMQHELGMSVHARRLGRPETRTRNVSPRKETVKSNVGRKALGE